MAATLFAIESLVPIKEVITYAPGTTIYAFFNATSFHPIIAGCIIGMMQFLLMKYQCRGLGASGSYVSITGYAVNPLLRLLNMKSSYLEKAVLDRGSWFQVLFVVFAIIGAATSAYTSNTFGAESGNMPITQAFVGGSISVFGARMANGCTSGHGLTGTALMSLNSFAATIAMFGGGILYAKLASNY